MSTATTLVFSPKRLGHAIAESGVSKRALTKRIGSSATSTVYRYLSGQKTPKPETVKKLADALGCRVEDLCVEVEL